MIFEGYPLYHLKPSCNASKDILFQTGTPCQGSFNFLFHGVPDLSMWVKGSQVRSLRTESSLLEFSRLAQQSRGSRQSRGSGGINRRSEARSTCAGGQPSTTLTTFVGSVFSPHEPTFDNLTNLCARLVRSFCYDFLGKCSHPETLSHFFVIQIHLRIRHQCGRLFGMWVP